MIVLILSILGSVLSLGGNILIARKKRIGWLTWIAGNLAWILVNFLGTMNVPMVLMYVAYFVTNIIGYVQWRKEEGVHKAVDKGLADAKPNYTAPLNQMVVKQIVGMMDFSELAKQNINAWALDSDSQDCEEK